ncbi:MAG: hypothetical protein ACREPQ_14725 [Rhodanobacter sp.]
MSKAVPVVIGNDDGTTSTYMPVSARLPKFLEMFPNSDGWRIERECKHASEFAPTLVALYTECFKAGINPKAAGLPPLPNGTIFTARLRAPSGDVVNSGSALMHVRDPVETFAEGMGLLRDWESGETAALQRLMAAQGLGGDVLNLDEVRVVERSKGRILRDSSPALSVVSSGAGDIVVVPMGEDTSRYGTNASAPAAELAPAGLVTDEPAAAPAVDDQSEKQVTQAAPAAVVEHPASRRKATPPASPDEVVLRSLQRNIDQLSKLLGREVVKVTSVAEAEKILTELGQARLKKE